MATPETKHFINGEFVPSISGKIFPIFNPTTEEKIVDVFEADAADVDAAVTAAENAFPAWKNLSAHNRINKCLKFTELIERDQFEIAKLDAENIGMPVSVNHLFIQRAIRDIKHTPGLAHDVHVNITLRQPYGVCAAILAWDAPVVIFTAKVIPCIVAGNTIIVKSSEKVPLSSLKLGALAAEAGFPPAVINVLSGFGHTVGAALSSHMKIRELKNPLIFNSGQICFLKAFSENFVEPKFGKTLEPTTFSAKPAGANLVTGGSRATSKGYCIQPTVFAKVPASADILHEEIFGPVAVVREFETEEEVVAECNKTEYGLHAGLYTRDISRACRLATALETGVVTVNSGGSAGAYDMPFGGWKQSGSGRELVKLGLEEFNEIKTVIITL
ncbi:Aldehyde/histidinol dehydrogenase [Trichoderma compactum]